MEPVYVFPDTNIFLHYQPFDQMRWTEILQLPQIVLVIAPVVVRELDEHKDQHRLSTIRDRARTALKKIEQSILDEMDTQLPDGVELEYAQEPTVDFELRGLRRDINDDHLIANCLTQRETETGSDVLLISGDTGPRLKAVQRGFKALSLPDKYKLPSALDAVEKDKKQLQRRVQQLENRLPKLKLAFANEANQFEAVTRQPFTVPEEEVQRQVAFIKAKHSKRALPQKKEPEQGYSSLLGQIQRPGIAAGPADSWSSISIEEVQRYNRELDEFYDVYEDYIRKYVQGRNLQHRTIRLNISLFNYGTAPAEDIDVFMHFPDGFHLYDKESRPRLPEKPDPPLQPQTGAEKMAHRSSSLYDFSPSLRSPPYMPVRGNVSSPKIERSNSYNVSYEVDRLKQHMNEPFEPLYVAFDSLNDVASFSIDYRINAAELPDEVTGVLHVVVDRD